MTAFTLLAGCSEVKPDGNDQVDEHLHVFDAAPQRQVSNTNLDGVWSMAVSVVAAAGSVTGFVTFTGPPGKSRQMGMCLVQTFASNTGGVICESATDCKAAPVLLPPGGSRYCVAADHEGRKFCHYRPGTRLEYCTGSPVLELAAVPQGTYHIEIAAAAGTSWRAMSCFEACEAAPAAISETVIVR